MRNCRLNPQRGQYHVSEAVWKGIIDGERRKKLQSYWAELKPEVKDSLAGDASIDQIFRDLRRDGLEPGGTIDEEFRLAQFDALNSLQARRSEVWVTLDDHLW